jgi:hypothetical protein
MVAQQMGFGFMDWQNQIADVAGEMDPETGLPAYREVIATIMRQSGKTIFDWAFEVDRGLSWQRPQRVVYSAQTGADARKKLLEDHFPILERSPLVGMVRHFHRAAGSESVLFKNGSRIGVAASSQDSGHGFTVDLGVVDEFWADQDDRREQAMLPAMSTRADAQLLLTSTMGTDASTYLNRKVEAGRAAAEADKGSGIAYFEWSIPADEDISSPDVWWRYMPALGWTISEGAVAHAFQTMEEAEFRRAFGNQATKSSHDCIIPIAAWEDCQDFNAEVPQGPGAVFAVDVLPDRSAGAIVASDGLTIELIDHQAGTGWMVERARGLAETYGGGFVVDGGGPAASIGNELELAGLTVYRMSNAEVAAACASMYDAIIQARSRFRADPLMTEAVEGLDRRPVGDRFIWSRSNSHGDITPFFAATLAFERAAHGSDPEVSFISFG